MKLTFLGTGAGIPSKERNVSAIVLNISSIKNELWLFDCGEATQHQILHTTLKPRKINKIFITHLHGDHIFGLPGLISSRSFLGGDDTLTIYGPKGIKQFVETSLQVTDTHLAYPIEFVEIAEAKTIFEDNQFIVDVELLDHGMFSLVYRVTEKDKLGELHVQKLKDLGIKPGPIYRKIKENEKTTLDDGTVLYREDFLGTDKKGRKLAIFGDTKHLPHLSSFIKDVDVVVHEATFSADKEELAYKYNHSTTKQAASLAKEAHASALILTHISSRYQKGDEAYLLEEARTMFPNTFIASDFYEYNIN